MIKPRYINSDGMRLETPYPTMGHAIEAGLIGEERRVMQPDDARTLLLKSAAEIKRLAAWNDRACARYRKLAIRRSNIAFWLGWGLSMAFALLTRASIDHFIPNMTWLWHEVLSWLR